MYSDAESISSTETIDRGFYIASDGEIEYEEPSEIFTHRCANCFRVFEYNEAKEYKHLYKKGTYALIWLHFCCAGCKKWGLYKLGKSKIRPRGECECGISREEGRKYAPPTISTGTGRFDVVVYKGFGHIEENPLTVREKFKIVNIRRSSNRRNRSRSR